MDKEELDPRLHRLYCEVGEHDFTTLKEVTPLDRCAICHRTMCPDHRGGWGFPSPGEWIGCIDHWSQVKRINESVLDAARRKIQGDPYILWKAVEDLRTYAFQLDSALRQDIREKKLAVAERGDAVIEMIREVQDILRREPARPQAE